MVPWLHPQIHRTGSDFPTCPPLPHHCGCGPAPAPAPDNLLLRQMIRQGHDRNPRGGLRLLLDIQLGVLRVFGSKAKGSL